MCGTDCKICKGIGFVRYNFPMDDRRFGKMFPCPNRAQEMLETLGGGGLTGDEAMNLKWETVIEGISDGHRAREYAKKIFSEGYGLLFLYGDYGQGKTLILKIGVAQSLRNGGRAAYANMSDILQDIRASFDADHSGNELARRMSKWLGLDVLAIDELDKVNRTDWAREVIHKLLDHRYTMAVRQQAITMVAANLDEGINTLDGYLASRLRDNRVGTMVQLHGPDAREILQKGYKY